MSISMAGIKKKEEKLVEMCACSVQHLSVYHSRYDIWALRGGGGGVRGERGLG